ncbi:hypothetical protein OPQ81_005470 [Rhizoctonia solani]|nr:hypothetical protein OPQ81_005470 [Rhizoctonia solani]
MSFDTHVNAPFEGNPCSSTINTGSRSSIPPATSGSSRDDRLKSWPHLTAFLKLLDESSNPLEALRGAVTGLADCIESCEDVLNGKMEYEALKDELGKIFEMLNQHYSSEASPAITASVESLCKDIERELQCIKEKLNRDILERSMEVSDDVDEVLIHYDRIRDYLNRVLLNADISMWRIVDASVTENRLDRLLPAMSACYNSAQAVELKRGPCTKASQIDALEKMIDWVGASSLGSVNWMSGMTETGKTAIVYSLCDKLAGDGKLAASFFCSRLSPECRNVNRIIPSIAYQLARFSRPFRSVLLDMLEKDTGVHTHLSYLQFDALIAQPLHRVKNTLPESIVVVIDALDECEAKEGTSRILDVLLTKSEDLPIKFVVSSPPEPDIWDRLTEQSDQDISRVVLHELDSYTVLLEFTPAKAQA